MKIGVDCDGTLFDLWPWSCEAVEKETGLSVKPEDWNSYYYLVEEFGRDTALRGFDAATNPDRMRDRPFFLNAIPTIKELQEDFDILFITYNHEPRRMASVLGPYLREIFGDVGLKVMDHSPSKIKLLKKMNINYIVDDKPKTVNEAVEEDMFAATIRHAYTHECNEGVKVFDDWKELPDMIREHAMVRS